MTKNNEIRSLTGLRGVAAIYVLLFHFVGSKSDDLIARLIGHGFLAVDLFFVLSGFVMMMTYARFFETGFSLKAFWVFLGRRIARIYPLYLFCSTATFILLLLGNYDYKGSEYFHLSGVLTTNVLMIQSWFNWPSLDRPTWSISAEWAAYLLFPVLILFAPKTITLLKLSTCLWVGLVAWMVLPIGSDLPLSPIRCVPEFALGLIAYRWSEVGAADWFKNRRWSREVVPALIVLLLFFPNCELSVILLCPILLVVLASGSSLAFGVLASSLPYQLGVYSYGIYLIHMIVAAIMPSLHASLSKHGIAHAQAASSFVALALTLILAVLCYRLIELPGRALVRQIFERDRAQPVNNESSSASRSTELLFPP